MPERASFGQRRDTRSITTEPSLWWSYIARAFQIQASRHIVRSCDARPLSSVLDRSRSGPKLCRSIISTFELQSIIKVHHHRRLKSIEKIAKCKKIAEPNRVWSSSARIKTTTITLQRLARTRSYPTPWSTQTYALTQPKATTISLDELTRNLFIFTTFSFIFIFFVCTNTKLSYPPNQDILLYFFFSTISLSMYI